MRVYLRSLADPGGGGEREDHGHMILFSEQEKRIEEKKEEGKEKVEEMEEEYEKQLTLSRGINEKLQELL